VLRRLLECLGRDRTKHQVAGVTSLGLVQMTRKRVGQGLHEVFAEVCEACNGRGYHIHTEPVEKRSGTETDRDRRGGRGRTSRKDSTAKPAATGKPEPAEPEPAEPEPTEPEPAEEPVAVEDPVEPVEAVSV
jgi:ribonuclease E